MLLLLLLLLLLALLVLLLLPLLLVLVLVLALVVLVVMLVLGHCRTALGLTLKHRAPQHLLLSFLLQQRLQWRQRHCSSTRCRCCCRDWLQSLLRRHC